MSKIVMLSRELQEDCKGCSTQGAEWIKNIQISCKGLLFSNRTITVRVFWFNNDPSSSKYPAIY